MQGGIWRVDRDGGKHSRCFLLLMTTGVSDRQLQVCEEYFCIWSRLQHDEKAQRKRESSAGQHGSSCVSSVFHQNFCWKYNHFKEIVKKAQRRHWVVLQRNVILLTLCTQDLVWTRALQTNRSPYFVLLFLMLMKLLGFLHIHGHWYWTGNKIIFQ